MPTWQYQSSAPTRRFIERHAATGAVATQFPARLVVSCHSKGSNRPVEAASAIPGSAATRVPVSAHVTPAPRSPRYVRRHCCGRRYISVSELSPIKERCHGTSRIHRGAFHLRHSRDLQRGRLRRRTRANRCHSSRHVRAVHVRRKSVLQVEFSWVLVRAVHPAPRGAEQRRISRVPVGVTSTSRQ